MTTFVAGGANGLSSEPRLHGTLPAFTGLRRSEIRGLRWENYDGRQIRVTQAVWSKYTTEPKTEKSKAAVPVIAPLQRMLDMHRLRNGNPAAGPIFTNHNGKPMDMNNLLQREILPRLKRCRHCGECQDKHAKLDHNFALDESCSLWHGWHAFRRGLATNLHDLGIDDQTIQRILRHSDVHTTQRCYIKTLPKQTTDAMKRFEDVIPSSGLVQ